jgi:hypothetical protein
MVIVDRIPRTSSVRRASTTFGTRQPAPSGGPKSEYHDAGEKSDDDVDAVPDVEMFTLIEKELGSA